MIRVASMMTGLDNKVKKKMLAGGVTATVLAATLIAGVGVLSGLLIVPYTDVPSNRSLLTIDCVIQHAFADYVPYDEQFTPDAPEYTILSDLSNIQNLDDFQFLTALQRQQIAAHGFVVVPQTKFIQIYDILDDNFERGIPSFITTDAVLHAFHVLYDNALREAEVYTFWDLLRALTGMLLDESYQQYLAAPEGLWKEAARLNVAYFTVALCLMDSSTLIAPEVETEVENVLSLIDAHSGISAGWFMGYPEDFTQYVPRGHYTRSETLGKYFRAMMWLGRIQFRLYSDTGEPQLQRTAQAMLIAIALRNDVAELGVPSTGYDVWDAIYEPTAFFVGDADDLLPSEYLRLINDTYGPDPTFESLNDDFLLASFIDVASELREPLILGSPINDTSDVSMTQGMRFMGQRFIPDSYILGQLVYKYVGTLLVPRLLPKGLDVMAALGSTRAWDLLDDQKHYYNYIEQMNKTWAMVDAITSEEWTRNLYYLWLYSLLPLLQEPGAGYPLFMRNSVWVEKQLATSLASWTELRHDTVLYGKQSYTIGITSIPPNPGGYVEPVPQVYARLASLCRMMNEGLASRDLLSQTAQDKVETFETLLLNLSSIAVKQLTGEPVNDDDLDLIGTAYRDLEYVCRIPNATDTDKYMALVVDVHTDPNSGSVLEEAVGHPMYIYVAVPIDGVLMLTRGGVLSYYEFTQPMSARLTDESWQAMLASGTEPAMPDWTSSFVVPKLAMMTAVLASKSDWE